MKNWRLIIYVIHLIAFLAPASWAKASSCSQLYANSTGLYKSATANSAWFDKIDFEALDRELAKEHQNINLVPMREFLKLNGKTPSGHSEVYYAEIKTEDNSILRAVFKPISKMQDAVAEVAAYKMAIRLGLTNVPPAVISKVNGREGLLMYFVESRHDFIKHQTRKDLWKKIDNQELSNLEVLHFLLGMWDRHSGNIIVDNNNHIAAIDMESISGVVQWRIGEFPWERRAYLRKEYKRENSVGEAQFYDTKVQYLDTRNLNGIITFLRLTNHWLGRKSNEQLKIRYENKEGFFFEITKFENAKIPYRIWKNQVWIPRQVFSMPKVELRNLDPNVVERIRSLTEEEIKALLPEPYFTPVNIALLLQRKERILRHYNDLLKH
jgi:hypothetical protein